MQWLRHTRAEPPSINEQQLDEIRQVQLKQLAAAADARWASKPSAITGPSKNNPFIGGQLRGGEESKGRVVKNTGGPNTEETGNVEELGQRDGEAGDPSPWKEIKSAKGAEQQPEAWKPKLAKRR
jgi:NADH dehydrogenase [ubiquinone] 1 alpha subcomplex assembly factor 2